MLQWLNHRIRAAWLLIPSALGVGAAVGWWVQLQPAAAEWGNVAAWVASASGLAAVAFTGSQLRLANHQRSLAMRDSLAVILQRDPVRGPTPLLITLINVGRFGMHHVRTEVVSRVDGRWVSLQDGQLSPPGGVVAPGRDVEIIYPDAPRGDDGDLGVRLRFTDAEGKTWSRTQTTDGQSVDSSTA
jgi:hypothetical protein